MQEGKRGEKSHDTGSQRMVRESILTFCVFLFHKLLDPMTTMLFFSNYRFSNHFTPIVPIQSDFYYCPHGYIAEEASSTCTLMGEPTFKP